MADHKFAFFAKCFDYFHQVYIVGLSCIVFEYRHCVATSEYKCVKFVFMPFEIGYHVIGKQGDAGIGLDLPGI